MLNRTHMLTATRSRRAVATTLGPLPYSGSRPKTYRRRTPVMAKRSTSWKWPPVETTMVRAGSVAPEKSTVVSQGEILAIAGDTGRTAQGLRRRQLAHLHSQALVDVGDVAADRDRRRHRGAVTRGFKREIGVGSAHDLPGGIGAGPPPHQVDHCGGGGLVGRHRLHRPGRGQPPGSWRRGPGRCPWRCTNPAPRRWSAC